MRLEETLKERSPRAMLDAEEHVVNSGRVVFSGLDSEAQQVIMRHR